MPAYEDDRRRVAPIYEVKLGDVGNKCDCPVCGMVIDVGSKGPGETAECPSDHCQNEGYIITLQ